MRRTTKKGFTLVELLVVVGIIAVLISILLPALNKARVMATKISCQANMKQLSMGVIMYATDNKGYYPSQDAMQINPNNPAGAWIPIYWYGIQEVGQYVNNHSQLYPYVTSQVLICPSRRATETTSIPRGQWSNDLGIGYNVATSLRNNYLYYRYPNVGPSDPSYGTQVTGFATYNSQITKMGRNKHTSLFLLFCDVSGGTAFDGGYRFVQLYNGAAGTLNAPNTGSNGMYLTNPSLEAASYRHGQQCNAAFLDGHVDSFHATAKDDQLVGTHKNDGLDAAWKNGQIVLSANGG